MPKTSAWVCNRTGNLVLTLEEHRAHLKAEARKRLDVRKRAREQAAFECALDQFRFTVRTVRQIEAWLLENYDAFARCNAHRVHLRHKSPSGLRTVKIDVNYGPQISNSHSAPIGRKTNWARKAGDDVPFHYPGFRGRITLEYDHWMENGVLQNVCIHTGTGGGGSGTVSYDVTLWAEDFPKLQTY